jgi:hypothetical protein
MRRVRGLRLVACLALGLALMVFAAPALGANASVRAYGAVAGTKRFTLKVDGKNRAVRLGFEKATKRFGLAPGVHVVSVHNQGGKRLARVQVTVRSAEKVTLAIAGTAAKPSVAAVREATAPAGTTFAWARLANLASTRTVDIGLAGQSFTFALVKGLKFGKTSKAFRIPKSAGYYDQGGLRLALRQGSQTLNTATFQFVAGGATTFLALPVAGGAKLVALTP